MEENLLFILILHPYFYFICTWLHVMCKALHVIWESWFLKLGVVCKKLMVLKNNAGKNSWQLKTIWYNSKRLKGTQAQKTTHPIYSWMYKCPGCRQTRPNDSAELLLTHTKNKQLKDSTSVQNSKTQTQKWNMALSVGSCL